MTPHANIDTEVTGVTDTSAMVVPDPVVSKGGMQSSRSGPRFRIEDVLPYRAQSAPLSTGLAPFSSADMFKSPANLRKPKAKRWDHRITRESASRKPSSLKGAMKYFTPDIISLCGGLPSSDYFPFESLSVKTPTVPAFFESETIETGRTLTAGKHDVKTGSSVYDLSIALNYGQSMGPPQLNRFIVEHTEIVHDPPYADWDICLTVGSTSSLDMSLRMFCERGDSLLTEEYAFSSAIETALPMGIQPVGIKMDAEGLLPEHMEHILSTWDELRQGKKPCVLYTVPTGQNPTSSTQSLSRRKAIYEVAEKHDLIILEDEPYYFLQMEKYTSGHVHQVPQPFTPMASDKLVESLIPSYLSLDRSGRVVRMDSFSKVIAPGSRTGWITASSQLIERFIRHQEVSSQTPSGFAMMALFKLLDEQWGHEGFLNWLSYIRAEYTHRRDVIVNACEKYMPPQISEWVAPQAGMFHWIRVDVSQHPKLRGLPRSELTQERLLEVEEQIFVSAVKENVLVARGSWFKAEKHKPAKSSADEIAVVNGVDPLTTLYFRMTFAAASEDKIEEAVRRFSSGLKAEFGLS